MSPSEGHYVDEWERGLLGALHDLTEQVGGRHQFVRVVIGADPVALGYLREIEELYARLCRHVSSGWSRSRTHD
ncbi:hypothetical protein ACKI1I_46120 [Streptomyces turgidiscabies]|uniref:Uncharacterized protein n=1 Tax=Streptomyces turgidiscabies (strain Car8) TaxID=698760 RepID=L7F1Z2_STRT8|nr:hypothetical protein STRTUCAR8_01334 [Streptomyces turgidiscabies Car8]GAQ76426.1 hypothetical protein T45_08221 [Streptomyces turgidiscabies]